MSTSQQIFEHRLTTGEKVTINIRRLKRARRMTLRALGRTFQMSVPIFASSNDILNFLTKSDQWLHDVHAKALEHAQARTLPEEVSIPLLKKKYPLMYAGFSTPDAATLNTATNQFLYHDETGVIILIETATELKLYGNKDIELCYKVLQLWAVNYAKILLPEYVLNLAEEMGVDNLKRINVRDQRTRWGSCSRQPDGTYNITLNWRAILLPEDCLRHLCFHELCHTQHMNHSEKFYAYLQRVNPEYTEQAAQLQTLTKEIPAWSNHL